MPNNICMLLLACERKENKKDLKIKKTFLFLSDIHVRRPTAIQPKAKGVIEVRVQFIILKE